MLKLKCHFCGSKKLRVPVVGIAFGMSGFDYSFCYKCLKNMSADLFWRKMCKEMSIPYPPKLKKSAYDYLEK